jgi:DNA processing protein
MEFDKYQVAYELTKNRVGRKKILENLYNQKFLLSQEGCKYKDVLSKDKIEVVSFKEDIYPKNLKNIPDYPLLLFLKGRKELFKKTMITIVGTRKMSQYGKWAVRYILEPLRHLDVVIVSGLANGIDVEVHKNCLDLDIDTLAIVAGGLDKGYPKSNQSVYNKISEKGLIVSEFPPGREIIKGMFPMRNRILAGISLATIIIESDINGGSLITMNLALEYGKEIFAVPCNISRYSLQGCNMLISQGAQPLFLRDQLYNFCRKCIR